MHHTFWLTMAHWASLAHPWASRFTCCHWIALNQEHNLNNSFPDTQRILDVCPDRVHLVLQHPSVPRRLSEVLLFASSCNFVVHDCITALWTSFFHSSLDGVTASRILTDGKLYFSVRSLIRLAQLHEGLSFIASFRTIKSLMNSVGGWG